MLSAGVYSGSRFSASLQGEKICNCCERHLLKPHCAYMLCQYSSISRTSTAQKSNYFCEDNIIQMIYV
ncbi:hypothetical protein BT93_C2388 [Corymbia citriodora subsp. variegata]|nr:hypothetical protein BT93_C2388 [Corymbia citriodora subsp. variegata]